MSSTDWSHLGSRTEHWGVVPWPEQDASSKLQRLACRKVGGSSNSSKSLLAGSYSGVTKSRTQLCHDSPSPASQTKSGAVSKCSVTAIPLALGTRTTQTSSQRSSN